MKPRISDRTISTRSLVTSTAIVLGICLLATFQCFAAEVTYRTGGKTFAHTWHLFYDVIDHEPDLAGPLVKQGTAMVPAICEAVKHKNMKQRRYAIEALGKIGSAQALPVLTAILENQTEKNYFRADALESIYQINQKLGQRYAEQYQHAGGLLQKIAEAVLKRAPWLLEDATASPDYGLAP